LGLALLLGAGALVGFVAGRAAGGGSALDSPLAASLAADARVRSVVGAGPRAGAGLAAGAGTPGVAPGALPDGRQPMREAPAAGSLEALATRNGLGERARRLERAFPPTESGRRLAGLSTLIAFGPRVGSAESEYVAAQLDWLKEHGAEAMAGIRAGLPALTAEDSRAHQFLLQLVSRLDVPEDDKHALLEAELVRPFEGERVYEGVAALTAWLGSAPPGSLDDRAAERIEDSLKRSLAAQADGHAREVLLMTYSTQEPDRGRRLAAALASPDGQ
jgi:hypothetical protein